jgi:hypothetical protein
MAMKCRQSSFVNEMASRSGIATSCRYPSSSSD